MNRFVLCCLAAAVLPLSACKTHPHEHDHDHHHVYGAHVSLRKSDYPHLPCGAFSEALREKAQVNPWLKERMFWGNYGGPGCLGGEPIDVLDRLFYQHDVSYLDGIKLRELRAADRLLVRQLKEVSSETLSPVADAYRRRAIRYFRNPISRWVGKPKDVLLRQKTKPTVEWSDK